MKLTDIQCRNAKPRPKLYKMADGDGLSLWVKPNGRKSWILSYSYAKKRQTVSFGSYPNISLSDARNMRVEARKLLAGGKNPSSVKQAARAQQRQNTNNTFNELALRWKAVKDSQIAPNTMKRVWQQMERHIFPKIGNIPITQISRCDLMNLFGGLSASQTVEQMRTDIKKYYSPFDEFIKSKIGLSTSQIIKISPNLPLARLV